MDKLRTNLKKETAGRFGSSLFLEILTFLQLEKVLLSNKNVKKELSLYKLLLTPFQLTFSFNFNLIINPKPFKNINFLLNNLFFKLKA